MHKTLQAGKDEVARLCRYFCEHKSSFHDSGAKEAHVRQSLIDPFFEALGWDVRNARRVSLQDREVIPEDSLDVEGERKAPDYSFRVGRTTRFYAEAKRCGVNIAKDSRAAYQLRRYGWSGKTAVSILTDFEEFAVYDCTRRPDPSEKASHLRTMYLTAHEYPDRWEEIWSIFSREAVGSGAFDAYAESKRRRGTSEVDEEFLKEIEDWRVKLAQNIALRNPGLDVHDLSAAVQKTIDRIVFLRMAEDRGLENYELLLKLASRPGIYRRFIRETCRNADDKYNSGLFHFRKEPGVSEAPDTLTPNLQVDDRILKPILQSLYFSHGSPYHFGVMPVEILGTVYERFLGKVIRLTPQHRAKIEDKPEVRKAGGVYYTPTYIVDYIVQNTIGRAIEGKSPSQLLGGRGRSPFRVLDMSCGSGSFLLGAFQQLSDHYLKWYSANQPKRHKNSVYWEPRSSSWKLTIEEKKKILRGHIFGVDIDPQAVEVSKLSLLLKSLEDENDSSLARQFELFHHRALPNLSENVQCGNSLIGSDYHSETLIANDEETRSINAFDWEEAFPHIMMDGGFDCVIGNPPWISLSGKFRNEILSDTAVSYLTRRYAGNTYMPNMYEYFIAKGLDLTREGGLFGYIVPDRFGFNAQFVELRKRMIETTKLQTLVYKAPFPKVTADTVIFVCEKGTAPKSHRVDISEYRRPPVRIFQRDLARATDYVFEYFDDVPAMRLLQKIAAHGDARNLSDLVESTSGFGGKSTAITNSRINVRQIETMKGDSIGRYQFKKKYYFDFCRENITGRTTDQRKLGAVPKILMRKTGSAIIATYDESGIFPEQSLYFLFDNRSQLSLKFVLGLLNSRLLNFYFQAKCLTNKKSIAQVKKVDLDKLPILNPNLADGHLKKKHDRIVSLVDMLLKLHSKLGTVRGQHQRMLIERQIAASERALDNQVYDLYGLSPLDVATIEQAKT